MNGWMDGWIRSHSAEVGEGKGREEKGESEQGRVD